MGDLPRECWRRDRFPKTAYLTERLAVDSVETAAARGVVLHHYRCGRCQSWHTASGPARQARAAS